MLCAASGEHHDQREDNILSLDTPKNYIPINHELFIHYRNVNTYISSFYKNKKLYAFSLSPLNQAQPFHFFHLSLTLHFLLKKCRFQFCHYVLEKSKTGKPHLHGVFTSSKKPNWGKLSRLSYKIEPVTNLTGWLDYMLKDRPSDVKFIKYNKTNVLKEINEYST